MSSFNVYVLKMSEQEPREKVVQHGGDTKFTSDEDSDHEKDSSLIRRKKASLAKRQKKWVDSFTGKTQIATFLIRELIANATDAILRMVISGKIPGFTTYNGRIDISLKPIGTNSVLLKVTDNDDGCESFRTSIMIEGTTINNYNNQEAVITGGKGSAKDCFAVQDGFKFVSKTIGGCWRYLAGSQDVALEYAKGCCYMNMDDDYNCGSDAESRIERMKVCDCKSKRYFSSSDNVEDDHGTTIELAVAPIGT